MDHPRVCGEHDGGAGDVIAAVGSSPRVRGTRKGRRGGRVRLGIIPACAGNTPDTSSASPRTWDHPRVCGEHMSRRIIMRSVWGSSPRVRGTRSAAPTGVAHAGIIPACAGNTAESISSSMTIRDHPRVCGEHMVSTRKIFQPSGSSPRVRGTHTTVLLPVLLPGIIPACAGNTPRTTRAPPTRRDHPRVCGEHITLGAAKTGTRGSSPRVRGTPTPKTPAAERFGIIPACAGNTRGPRRCGRACRDHPRVCGEHQWPRLFWLHHSGSSPRVRGTLAHDSGRVIVCGIIPACAGNTWGARVCGFSNWDHPRVCGEHLGTLHNAMLDVGSSPRVRGTHIMMYPWSLILGIIPACAGNTRLSRSLRW